MHLTGLRSTHAVPLAEQCDLLVEPASPRLERELLGDNFAQHRDLCDEIDAADLQALRDAIDVEVGTGQVADDISEAVHVARRNEDAGRDAK